MNAHREAYRRFAKRLLKSALSDKDFGFIDRPTGQLALGMLDDPSDIIAAFRQAQEKAKSGGARLS